MEVPEQADGNLAGPRVDDAARELRAFVDAVLQHASIERELGVEQLHRGGVVAHAVPFQRCVHNGAGGFIACHIAPFVRVFCTH